MEGFKFDCRFCCRLETAACMECMESVLIRLVAFVLVCWFPDDSSTLSVILDRDDGDIVCLVDLPSWPLVGNQRSVLGL